VTSLRLSVCAIALATTSGTSAQQPRAFTPPSQPAPQAPAQTQPAPPASTRTEILTFENWTVTCRDGRDPKDKRVCVGELQISQTSNNVRNVIFAWSMGLNPAGAPVAILRVPPGVLIAPGIDLKLAAGQPRKIPFTLCEPNRCEAALVMDEAFVRDAESGVAAEATIYASDGRGLKFSIVNKGFKQALAAIRR
jgi:invasion protein IalB